MEARAGATTNLRMRGRFIRMASCYAWIRRRASYGSPPHFPGGTVARGTTGGTRPGGEGRSLERSKCLAHSLISSDALRKTCWRKKRDGEHSRATASVERTLLSAAFDVDFDSGFDPGQITNNPKVKSGGQECPPTRLLRVVTLLLHL